MKALLGTCAVVALVNGALGIDVTTGWNDEYCDTIRVVGGAPCPVDRTAPMMNLSMFDAVNGIQRVTNFAGSYTPYQQGLAAPNANSSQSAAAAVAAHRVLSSLYGTLAGNSPQNQLLQARYDARLANDLAAIPDTNGQRTNGASYGQYVADHLLASRANDGFNADSSYTPGGHAGDWRVTPDGPNTQPFTPQWGNVTPWGLSSGSQFRPPRFVNHFNNDMDALMHSAEYAEQINGGPGVPGVKELGSRNSATRTADQTEAAWFWANDRNGTSKPPGQLIQLTKTVLEQNPGRSIMDNARAWGLVSIALGDACIAAWDAKYNTPIDLWRPIDAIRESQDDGNPLTTPDPNWLPLNDFTPPFPAYVSGHATFGAAHAAVMASLFGDNTTFTLGSDEFAVNPGLGYAPDLTRTFHSFSDAAWENAMSRVWLGVHFYWDALDANTLGYEVGNWAAGHYLVPVPAPSVGLTLVGAVGMIAGRRKRR